jgi:KIF-1 binding protein C terminal
VFFSDPKNQDGPNLKDPKVVKKVESMNKHGLVAANLYAKILEFMDTEDYKNEKDNDDYIQSTINAKFAIAKIFSGMLPSNVS